LPSGTTVRLLDVGCGGGYFVFSALGQRLAASGIDVGQEAVRFGNEQMERLLGQRPLAAVSESDFYELVAASDATVLSAIGVLEHLREPHRLLDAFRRSAIGHFYFSVPMFSLSALLENAWPEVFPRQLSGGHTHLFTEDSLAWLYRSQGLTPVAEWRFGTDVMDLYRGVKIRLQQSGSSAGAIERLDAGLGRSVDVLQAVLDQGHFCSEIHCLVAR
jgi:SAM-dependent methyltransferase